MAQECGVLRILTYKCASRTAASHFAGSNLPKCARESEFFHILTYKCASRHSVRFLDIGTSKSGPALRCFVHFDLQMCFATQGRRILPYRILP